VVSAIGSVVAFLFIARPQRAAAAAAAASAAEAEAAAEPVPAAQELSIQHSRSWAIAAPSVVRALPGGLATHGRPVLARPELEVVDGPAAGTRISLDHEPLVLGRGESGAGTLGDDAELSRRHATISLSDGAVVVEDHGSTNGTEVNGRQISEPTPVSSGDSIAVGSSVLRVHAPSPAAHALQMQVQSGPAAGTRIAVGHQPVVFGRAETGEGTLGDDPELSRRHASASVLDDGHLLVEDLGSTNGTFVNDRRIAGPTVVGPGDSLELGGTSLEVVAG
jgi:pSer/pThr/pTyr-binding forkhead associated (FHA) protein